MNDIYIEWLVERKPNPMAGVIRVAAYILTGFFAATGFFIAFPLLILAAAMVVVDYIFLPKLNVEYEYLYMQRSLTIDSIFSKEKRKNAAEYDLDKMEIFAAEGADRLSEYKNRNLRTRDFSSGYPDRKRYVMIINSGKEMEKVILEPDERIVDAVKAVYPSKVINTSSVSSADSFPSRGSL
ncbi:MAG: hypothetical protein IJT63_04790 [Lachnospiraceae bacterium]|nr:hypothetical protein [Lachnospiraceae bacterium]